MVLDEVASGSLTHLGFCIVWGIAVAGAIISAGKIHESHYNPAVTLALVFAGKFSREKSLEHIGAQIAGAVTASIILHFVFPLNHTLGATLPTVSAWGAAGIEVVISFLLMAAIAFTEIVGSKWKNFPAIVIGIAVMLLAYFAGPLTGASMNPARSIGPAIISGHTENLWLYLIAPVVGMILAVPLYRFVKPPTN